VACRARNSREAAERRTLADLVESIEAGLRLLSGTDQMPASEDQQHRISTETQLETRLNLARYHCEWPRGAKMPDIRRLRQRRGG